MAHGPPPVCRWVENCGVCGQCRGPNPNTRAGLVPNQPSAPFNCLCVDVIGPLPKTKDGNRFILSLVDDFSKWAEAIPLKVHTAKAVATAILHNWTARYGVPKELLSDQGPEFESAVFKHICAVMGITKLRSSPYHPQGNGAVERLNRTLKSLLIAHTEKNRANWDQTLPFCLWAYRSNVHHSTGFTPGRLVLGRDLRFPIDAVLESSDGAAVDAADYAEWVKESLKQASRDARENLIAAKRRQKHHYDRTATTIPHYEVGDMVWAKNHRVQAGLNAKLSRPWTGPYIVSRVISSTNVEIRDPSTARRIPPIHVMTLSRVLTTLSFA